MAYSHNPILFEYYGLLVMLFSFLAIFVAPILCMVVRRTSCRGRDRKPWRSSSQAPANLLLTLCLLSSPSSSYLLLAW